MAAAEEAGQIQPTVLEESSVPEIKQGPNDQRPKADNQGEQAPAEGPVAALNQIEAAIRDLVAEQRAANEKGPAEHEISDLEAQEDMAFWAKLMFLATAVATSLTLAGVFLIWRTLHHTRRAADYTEKMLREAQETTREAKRQADAAIAQVRADVQVFITKIRIVDGLFAIYYQAKNIGNTPAYTFSITMGVKLIIGKEETPEIICTKYDGPSIEHIHGRRTAGSFCVADQGERLNIFEAAMPEARAIVTVRHSYINAFGETVTGRDIFLAEGFEQSSEGQWGSDHPRQTHTDGTRGHT